MIKVVFTKTKLAKSSPPLHGIWIYIHWTSLKCQ